MISVAPPYQCCVDVVRMCAMILHLSMLHPGKDRFQRAVGQAVRSERIIMPEILKRSTGLLDLGNGTL